MDSLFVDSVARKMATRLKKSDKEMKIVAKAAVSAVYEAMIAELLEGNSVTITRLGIITLAKTELFFSGKTKTRIAIIPNKALIKAISKEFD